MLDYGSFRLLATSMEHSKSRDNKLEPETCNLRDKGKFWELQDRNWQTWVSRCDSIPNLKL